MLLEILFPKFCIYCKRKSSYICPRCVEKIEFIQKQFCPYCLKVSKWGKVHERCRRPNELDGLISFFYYTNISKKIITTLKYRLVHSLLDDIFDILSKKGKLNLLVLFSQIVQIQSIQPIPLHQKRERVRGFNQAQYIAKKISEILEVPVEKSILRTKHTPPLALSESKVERHYFIKNAFNIAPGANVKDKKILLVDDIFTTGSTTKEAARVLKRGGAAEIYVFTLAHG